MNILAFDTSTEYLTVAALKTEESNKCISEISHFGALEHAEKIIPIIEKSLDSVRLTLNQCDAFVIGQGPGSFTGLRVGFGTLQGFAVSTGKPCYGIPSLDVIAQAGVAYEGGIAVIMDARREKVYLGLYETRKGQLTRRQKYFCINPDEAIGKIKRAGKKIWITGTGLSKYGAYFKKNLRNALFADEKFWYPRGSNLMNLFLERRQQLKPLSVFELTPLYLQEPHIGMVKTKAHGK